MQDSLNHVTSSLLILNWKVNYISSKIGLKTELNTIFQNSTLKAKPNYYNNWNKVSIDFFWTFYLLSPANVDKVPKSGIQNYSNYIAVDSFLTVASASSYPSQLDFRFIEAYFDK